MIHHPGESEACLLPMLSSLRVCHSLLKGLSETDSSRTGVRDLRLSNIFSFHCSPLVPFQSAVLIDTEGRGAGGERKKWRFSARLCSSLSCQPSSFFSTPLSVTSSPLLTLISLLLCFYNCFSFFVLSFFPPPCCFQTASCQQLPPKTAEGEQDLYQ